MDAFIRSYDSSGGIRWTEQFGTASDEIAYAVATDGNGNVYASGYTQAELEGTTAGGWDVFIRSYDSAGDIRWTRQFGTSGTDIGFGIATDADGNVYATGYTNGALEGVNAGGRDGFVRSYDRDGGLRWTRQFGTFETDEAYAIASDANGNVYSAGYTEGVIEGGNAGGADAFVRSFDRDGALRWTRQFGTSSNEEVEGIAADPSGSVYAAGSTDGALVGVSAGSSDSFVRKYGP